MALTVPVDEIVNGSRNRLLSVRPHWKRIRLGEIASVLNGFAFKSGQFTKGAGMPLIRIRDVGSDSTDTNYVGEFHERYIVEPGDLLIGMDGDFNCARWRGPRGLLNQRVCKVTLQSDQYHPRFLDFVLPGYLKAINDTTSSVTVKHLSSRTVEDIPLPIPPLHEQEEIVAELEKQFSRLDEAVASLQRVRSRLRGFAATALQEVFDASPSAIASPLLDACYVVSGFAFRSQDFSAGGVPVVKIANVGYGEFVWKDQQYLPNAFLSRYATFEVRPGDVLLALTRPVTDGKLKVCCYPDEAPPALLNQRVALLRTESRVDARYLLAQMRSPAFKRQVLDAVSQTLQPNLSPVQLKGFSIRWPAKCCRSTVAAEVDRRLSIVREVEAEVGANLKRAQALRQAVLEHAFAARTSAVTEESL